MNKAVEYFHKLSYLQYPFMLLAVWYAIVPYTYLFDDPENYLTLALADYQNMLIFLGIGISFSTLQDTTKTQNNFSLKIWQSPRKGKVFIAMLGLCIVLFFLMGIIGLYLDQGSILNELSYGCIVMAIGILGMLKTAIEMFENHRLDKPKNNS